MSVIHRNYQGPSLYQSSEMKMKLKHALQMGQDTNIRWNVSLPHFTQVIMIISYKPKYQQITENPKALTRTVPCFCPKTTSVLNTKLTHFLGHDQSIKRSIKHWPDHHLTYFPFRSLYSQIPVQIHIDTHCKTNPKFNLRAGESWYLFQGLSCSIAGCVCYQFCQWPWPHTTPIWTWCPFHIPHRQPISRCDLLPMAPQEGCILST